MTASAADVQAKLDAATTALAKTTSSYSAMVKKHGADWTKWPVTSNWYVALSQIRAARTEAGQLVAPSGSPTAAFAFKET